VRRSQQRGWNFLGPDLPEPTLGDGSRSPLDAARIIRRIRAGEPKPQVLREAGRGGVGLLTAVTQQGPKLLVGD
jgi:hypothetical protein